MKRRMTRTVNIVRTVIKCGPLPLLLISCAPVQKEVRVNSIRRVGLYEVSRPPSNWHVGALDRVFLTESARIRLDFGMRDCDTGSLITVGTADYVPPLRSRTMPSGVEADSFTGAALLMAEDYLGEKGDQREVLNIKPTMANDHEATEVLIRSVRKPLQCGSKTSEPRIDVTSETVFIRLGHGRSPFSTKRGWSPNTIFLSYSAPKDRFAGGKPAFDSMVKSIEIFDSGI